MEMPVNRFKRGLKSGEILYGFWAGLCSPTASEVIATSGADWLCIDTEHAAVDLTDVIQHLRALKGTDCAPVVRPAWNDMVIIKRLLDGGVQSLLVPYVQSAEEARAAVAATRYPPDGVRGVAGANRTSAFGRVKDYLQTAHQEIAVVVQIETRKAVENLEAIAAVEGLDGILVGPSDLSASLGHLGNPGHPEVQAVIADIAARAKAAGCPAGLFCMTPEEAERGLAMGYRFFSLGVDVAFVRQAADALVKRFKG
ncbi:MAG TPA: HpcH/HpaI aldolase/citrate lyase family protein [Paracoccaceae bacterium]|nr:HpcH/HpaI aldolase/citrate lyase family protein [Paracoccaceae bacterium]